MQLEDFLRNRKAPANRDEYEAFDRCAPFVLAYEWDPHYGPVVVLTCRALFDNVLKEFSFWQKRGQRIFTLKADGTFKYDTEDYVLLDFTTDSLVYIPEKGKCSRPKAVSFKKLFIYLFAPFKLLSRIPRYLCKRALKEGTVGEGGVWGNRVRFTDHLYKDIESREHWPRHSNVAFCFAVAMTESEWAYYVPMKGMVKYAKQIFNIDIPLNVTCTDAMKSFKAALLRLSEEFPTLKGSLDDIVFTKDTAHVDRTWEKKANQLIPSATYRK